ncbi:hypothetical protein RIF29_31228 [Crotalaria pallida]|uniref:Uncharacterized protein n=1 Tax=Crotalaria pallida TaxID=3830 RepID=A0AAN9I1Q8_CROPI
MTRPPDAHNVILSPSSLSIAACLEAEEAYQRTIRGEEGTRGDERGDSFQDMEDEFVPETQLHGMEDVQDTFDH